MALPSQRLQFRKYKSRIDPEKRDSYGIFGFVLFVVCGGLGAANIGTFGGPLAGFVAFGVLLFFMLDRFRDNYPKLADRASCGIALLGVAFCLWAAGTIARHRLGSDEVYTTDVIIVDAILVALVIVYLGYIAWLNRPVERPERNH